MMKTEILTASDEDVARAAYHIKNGDLVAFPTETVYGLGANALDENAVKKIYIAKGRPSDNPLIVHIAELDDMRPLVREIPGKARLLAEKFWPGPLTMILPKTDLVPAVTSGGLDSVGIRMPSNEIARRLIKASGVPIAAPSANISGLPSPTEFEHVFDDMNTKIPAIINGGSCDVGVESTVLSLCSDVPRILRPGGVTKQMLEEVVGVVEVDKAVLNPLENGSVAASPGMKYKHYSPKADITVIKGELPAFAEFVKRHTTDDTAVLCFEGEEEYFSVPVVTMGRADDGLSQTARLFTALRELDETGARRVYARNPSADGVGLAVCNRLYRAAAFKIYNANPVIGLTGKTGAGKSTIADVLKNHGCEIIDCDKIARELTQNGSEFLNVLAEEFGSDIVSCGVLNRQKLAERAFSSEDATARLNALMHPEIIRRSCLRAEDAVKRGVTAVIDAPLLFECKMESFCDFTVAVLAPENIRLKRIMKRDGITEEQARLRMNTQKYDDEFYRTNADFIIVNDDTDEYLSECEKIPY